jgi:hypothetical protein
LESQPRSFFEGEKEHRLRRAQRSHRHPELVNPPITRQGAAGGYGPAANARPILSSKLLERLLDECTSRPKVRTACVEPGQNRACPHLRHRPVYVQQAARVREQLKSILKCRHA